MWLNGRNTNNKNRRTQVAEKAVVWRRMTLWLFPNWLVAIIYARYTRISYYHVYDCSRVCRYFLPSRSVAVTQWCAIILSIYIILYFIFYVKISYCTFHNIHKNTIILPILYFLFYTRQGITHLYLSDYIDREYWTDTNSTVMS